MFQLRKFAPFLCALILALAHGSFAQQGSQQLPALVISDSPQGIRIVAVHGTLPNARVLRLSSPDRLVLDFDQTEFRMSETQRAFCAAHGMRVGFHSETATTRVVFDIPSGQQRWMKLERGAVLVEYRPELANPATGTQVASLQPATRAVKAPVPPQRTMPPVSAQSTARMVSPKVAKAASAEADENPLRVTTMNGLLQVSARDVSFKAILDTVAAASGASVQMMTPVQEGQRQIFEYGPAPPLEVIRKLFEGSRYNYLVISEPNDTTRISRIVVTSAVHYLPGNDGPVADDDSNPEALQGITPMAPKPEVTDDRKPN